MMRSYQIIEFGKPLQMRAYQVPQPRGSEVLVQVEACGVCHSDLHMPAGVGHEIEAQLEDLHQPTLLNSMLMMRRNEKDFILQRDQFRGRCWKNSAPQKKW